MAELLADGIVVAAPDHEGLGTDEPHPSLVGEVSGRSVVDAAWDTWILTIPVVDRWLLDRLAVQPAPTSSTEGAGGR